jgi:hypothetical protein
MADEELSGAQNIGIVLSASKQKTTRCSVGAIARAAGAPIKTASPLDR